MMKSNLIGKTWWARCRSQDSQTKPIYFQELYIYQCKYYYLSVNVVLVFMYFLSYRIQYCVYMYVVVMYKLKEFFDETTLKNEQKPHTFLPRKTDDWSFNIYNYMMIDHIIYYLLHKIVFSLTRKNERKVNLWRHFLTLNLILHYIIDHH